MGSSLAFWCRRGVAGARGGRGGGGGGVGIVAEPQLGTAQAVRFAERRSDRAEPEVRVPVLMVMVPGLLQVPAVEYEIVGGGRDDRPGWTSGGGDELAAVGRRAGRFQLDRRPVLQPVLEQRHVAVRQQALQGGAGTGGRVDGRVRQDQLAERVLLRDDQLAPVRHTVAGALDPRVQIHPGVARVVAVLLLHLAARHGRVGDRRPDDRCNVLDRAHVVLGQLLRVDEYPRARHRVGPVHDAAVGGCAVDFGTVQRAVREQLHVGQAARLRAPVVRTRAVRVEHRVGQAGGRGRHDVVVAAGRTDAVAGAGRSTIAVRVPTAATEVAVRPARGRICVRVLRVVVVLFRQALGNRRVVVARDPVDRQVARVEGGKGG